MLEGPFFFVSLPSVPPCWRVETERDFYSRPRHDAQMSRASIAAKATACTAMYSQRRETAVETERDFYSWRGALYYRAGDLQRRLARCRTLVYTCLHTVQRGHLLLRIVQGWRFAALARAIYSLRTLLRMLLSQHFIASACACCCCRRATDASRMFRLAASVATAGDSQRWPLAMPWTDFMEEQMRAFT